jgi:predicted aspartyl protease
MGIFHTDCTVVNVRQPKRSVTVPRLLVDSGSEFTCVPETALKRARVTVVKKHTPFVMANGQTITRSTGYAILRAAGFETVDEVVFGQPGDLALLGARTLVGFGATIDPARKRLVAAGPRPAATGRTA